MGVEIEFGEGGLGADDLSQVLFLVGGGEF